MIAIDHLKLSSGQEDLYPQFQVMQCNILNPTRNTKTNLVLWSSQICVAIPLKSHALIRGRSCLMISYTS